MKSLKFQWIMALMLSLVLGHSSFAEVNTDATHTTEGGQTEANRAAAEKNWKLPEQYEKLKGKFGSEITLKSPKVFGSTAASENKKIAINAETKTNLDKWMVVIEEYRKGLWNCAKNVGDPSSDSFGAQLDALVSYLNEVSSSDQAIDEKILYNHIAGIDKVLATKKELYGTKVDQFETEDAAFKSNLIKTVDLYLIGMGAKGYDAKRFFEFAGDVQGKAKDNWKDDGIWSSVTKTLEALKARHEERKENGFCSLNKKAEVEEGNGDDQLQGTPPLSEEKPKDPAAGTEDVVPNGVITPETQALLDEAARRNQVIVDEANRRADQIQADQDRRDADNQRLIDDLRRQQELDRNNDLDQNRIFDAIAQAQQPAIVNPQPNTSETGGSPSRSNEEGSPNISPSLTTPARQSSQPPPVPPQPTPPFGQGQGPLLPPPVVQPNPFAAQQLPKLVTDEDRSKTDVITKIDVEGMVRNALQDFAKTLPPNPYGFGPYPPANPNGPLAPGKTQYVGDMASKIGAFSGGGRTGAVTQTTSANSNAVGRSKTVPASLRAFR